MVSIQNYFVHIGDVAVLRDVSLTLQPGSVHALMGPNGSGKSSLVATLMGHPAYHVTQGTAIFEGQDLGQLTTHQRALLGLYLAVQHPIEIDGLQVLHFLQELSRVRQKSVTTSAEFLQHILKLLDLVGLPESILYRSVNVGFSGGEKKRFELLQLLLLEPKVILLDEIDSGVDVDGLKMIAQGLQWYKQQHPDVIMLIVTHYRKIVDYITPDCVHIMVAGNIVQSGTVALLDEIEKSGYEPYAKGT